MSHINLYKKDDLELKALGYYAFRNVLWPEGSRSRARALKFIDYCEFLMAMTCLYGDLDGSRSPQELSRWYDEHQPDYSGMFPNE